MHGLKNYDYGGASGVPRRAHNHALSSAIAHMELGVLLSDNKLFRKAFKNYEAAIKYQEKTEVCQLKLDEAAELCFIKVEL